MSVDRELKDITALLSNCLDAFTCALFVWDDRSKLLTLKSFQSLSKNIIPNVQFAPEDGGLVGRPGIAEERAEHLDRTDRGHHQRREQEPVGEQAPNGHRLIDLFAPVLAS